ncbi:MAG TPA: 6-carboxytetrahydropterin synthase [Bacteroidales bacterium]|nr:6-carboxytetrahydropterin synthase [Bacteroidales bacterium]HNQ83757.1 6-carboxytetrahydropterin synthase [Bacteroidales bacterium]HOX78942.1 6-carboxytetrahydropterin synthase [Bacteroidales bacterium]HPI86795.1 6-carboxytetrahydropterin synthase [Bacteroidales bacterium]HPM93786.1 6-carboxytetrahydropterin synthase [Bacteroidales bacterium]
MTIIRISKEFNFDMAHALLGYDGLCRNIHGHSYTLVVTIIGTPVADPASPKTGMLIDFKDLKNIIKTNIVDPYDHALVLNADTPKDLLDTLVRNYEKIVVTPYQPTTENMIADLADRISRLLPGHVKLYSLKLRETPSSFAEWYAEDQ